ncbi:hypothetical protein JQX08_00540 [Pseudomonas sp. UL073]|uniref:Uncharacterized protein n=1 Tax=Zestomonas insulae TaxID=2809017 RepID=A0ABS2I8C0_9GAMM|nr:hypothetical protein [Pseudomonas insulae]MBM7059187.1 hypothetical protein [Pseudomonas insulae]
MSPTAPLLLAALLSVDASLELHTPSPNLAELRLCFRGNGQQVRFELETQAGSNRSRQAGELRAGVQAQCPTLKRMTLRTEQRLESRLRWWVDGIEQPPLIRQLEGAP